MTKRRKTMAAFLALLFAVIFALAVSADEEQDWDFDSLTLDEALESFFSAHGLNENNFSMGWYDTVTGESYYFNADKFMPAGSMYKLPLNMQYTDLIASGEVSGDDKVSGYSVSQAMMLSIVYSDNDAASALRRSLEPRLGGYTAYRNALASYSGVDTASLPQEYYSSNRMSPKIIVGTLQYLYEHSDSYGELIENMKLANPGRFFDKSGVEYEIAHKYGYYESHMDDCAIVYAPHPFLLTAFEGNISNQENTLAALCSMMTQYSVWLSDREKAEEARLAEEEAARLAAEEEARAAEEAARAAEEEAARQAEVDEARRIAEEKRFAEEEAARLAAEEAEKEALALKVEAKHRAIALTCAAAVLFAAGGIISAVLRKKRSRTF